MAFLRSVRRLARALDLQSSRINRDSGLTLPQYVVLTAIAELGDGSSRAIAAAADLSPPTVVGILDKLHEKGLILRRRSEGDRRSVQSRLSPAGAEVLDAGRSPLGPEFERRFSALAPADRDRLLAALTEAAELAGAAPSEAAGS